jgi:fructosamine-3-kinase
MLDPASSIGDAVADIAMTKLFGGVPNAFYQAWNEAIGELSQERERIAAAQMLHLLNHVRLFGDGYVPRLMAVAETLE